MIIRISNKKIGEDNPVFFVAEAGINHNGSLRIAKKMINEAKKAGADAIKFQTFKAEDLATPDSDYYKIFKNVELDDSGFGELSDYAKNKEIMFFSTPFSEHAVDMLFRLRVPMFKIASGDLTHIPLLRYTAAKKKPMIISTGLANVNEVQTAVKAIRSKRNNKIIIMHSVSSYPTPSKESNLKAMDILKEEFPYPIGYSDNGEGNIVPLTAVAAGAKIIEKHFTLNKKMKGPDHLFSSNPKELKILVKKIREVENILGKKLKHYQQSEEKIRILARRSIYANQNIPKGIRISSKMLTIKRPAKGIPPSDLNRIIGKVVKKEIKIHESLKWQYLTK